MPGTILRNRPTGAIPLTREQIGRMQPHKLRAMAQVPYNPVPKQIDMWGNSNYGDCVSAAVAFKLACQVPEIFIPASNVIAWAGAKGFLNGADPGTVNEAMQADGMLDANGNQWGEGPANYIALTDQAAMEAALLEGPLSVTVSAGQLQKVVGSSNGWIAYGLSRDTRFDHEPAISACGTFATLAPLVGARLGAIDPNTYGYLMFTWDSVGLIDRQSLLNIGQDALLALPTAVAQGVVPGPSPSPGPTPAPTPTPRPCPRMQSLLTEGLRQAFSDPHLLAEIRQAITE